MRRWVVKIFLAVFPRIYQTTHAKFTLFSLSKYGNSGNVPYRPPKLLRYCKAGSQLFSIGRVRLKKMRNPFFEPCMKSLKPNELHNYIYQSGPEDEAWKLPVGIDRLIVLDPVYDRPEFELWNKIVWTVFPKVKRTNLKLKWTMSLNSQFLVFFMLSILLMWPWPIEQLHFSSRIWLY